MDGNQIVSSTNREKKQKRPIFVWIISIFYILSVGFTLLSFILMYGGVIPINDAQQSYFSSLSLLDIAPSIIAGFLNLLGAVLLFLLKRYAFHAFLSAFFISMFITVLHILSKNWIDAIGGPGSVGASIGWLISIAVIIYSKSLLNRNILK
jgi:hypothetical protein